MTGPDVGQRAGSGLRERKKQLTRRLISDTATTLFLRNGFDAVRVVDVATACQVSEKTIYNYFPTKESLVFDRFEDMEIGVRRAFGPEGETVAPVEAAVDVIAAGLASAFDAWGRADRRPDSKQMSRFAEMIQQTPALRAAQWAMLDQMSRVVAEGVARRVGGDPDDPEPRIAAHALVGLWRVQFGALVRHAVGAISATQLRDRVMADVRRAAQLIDTGLWSLGVNDNPDAPGEGTHRRSAAEKGPAGGKRPALRPGLDR